MTTNFRTIDVDSSNQIVAGEIGRRVIDEYEGRFGRLKHDSHAICGQMHFQWL
jgi:hypothetical protein